MIKKIWSSHWQPILKGTEALPSFVLTDAQSILDWIWPAVARVEGGETLIDEDISTSSGNFINTEIHPFDEIAEFVEAKADVLSSGIDRKKIDKLGTRGAENTELTFQDCRIPAENLLGEEGKGVVYLGLILAEIRIMTGALALGLAKTAFEDGLNLLRSSVLR